jgi:8-oxo-dGTP diphosphatase
VKQQCVLYITTQKQLLVFSQPNPRWSTMQVVKGVLELGETPLDAASRILQSETGLTLEHPILLDSQIWEFSWEGETNLELVHYVWFQALTQTPETWTYNGSSNEFDQPRTYTHQFLPLEKVKLEWEMAVGLPKLLEALTARTRVLAYITRNRAEILVFKHDVSYPDAGVQVPGGGLEPNETLELGIMREVLEETGLKLPGTPVFLGARVRQSSQYGPQFEHYFWLEADPDTPHRWTHQVSSGEFDAGMNFRHEFVPLEDHEIDFDMDVFILALKKRMASRERVVCYITRNRKELLVFDHNDPQLSTGAQVVAGGIDDGETLAQAATREVLEEAGLKLKNSVFLGSDLIQAPPNFTGDTNPQLWHYFWFETLETRDAWDHVVTGGGEDTNEVYRQEFVKLEDVKLAWGLDELLEKLNLYDFGERPIVPKKWRVHDGTYKPYEGIFESPNNPLRTSEVREFYLSRLHNGQINYSMPEGEVILFGNRVEIYSEDQMDSETKTNPLWVHEFKHNAYVRTTDFGEYSVWDSEEKAWYIFWAV